MTCSLSDQQHSCLYPRRPAIPRPPRRSEPGGEPEDRHALTQPGQHCRDQLEVCEPAAQGEQAEDQEDPPGEAGAGGCRVGPRTDRYRKQSVLGIRDILVRIRYRTSD